MAKIGKRTQSDWLIGACPVNSYKARVPDPAVRRKRRTANDVRRCGLVFRDDPPFEALKPIYQQYQ